MKKKYNWIKKLIGRITSADAPLNNFFTYYGYEVNQTSGTADYTSVYITGKHGCIVDFSFDFWTYELNFVSYADDDVRMAVVEAFLEYYNPITISDDTLDERRGEYQEYLDNPEEYMDEAVEEARQQMDIINSLPLGRFARTDLKKTKGTWKD